MEERVGQASTLLNPDLLHLSPIIATLPINGLFSPLLWLFKDTNLIKISGLLLFGLGLFCCCCCCWMSRGTLFCTHQTLEYLFYIVRPFLALQNQTKTKQHPPNKHENQQNNFKTNKNPSKIEKIQNIPKYQIFLAQYMHR